MEQILLVFQVIIAAALIGMVLIQRSETDGFGLGSGGGSGLMSGRAKASLLTRTTAILAALFIINSLGLSVIAAHKHAPSIVEEIERSETVPAAVATKDKKDSKADKAAKADAAKKSGAPVVPNADESATPAGPKNEAISKPAAKVAKKVKPAVDAENNTDTTGANKE